MRYSGDNTTASNEDENSYSSPPLSWDIFMNSYWRKMLLLEDAKTIYDLSKQADWKHNWDFRKEILMKNKIVIVTTPALKIVTVSSNITSMNGYDVEEIIGKSPNMFQGPETQESSRKIIREAIWDLVPFETDIINYQKNGQPYNCHIHGFPIFDTAKKLAHFIAFEDIV